MATFLEFQILLHGHRDNQSLFSQQNTLGYIQRQNTGDPTTQYSYVRSCLLAPNKKLPDPLLEKDIQRAFSSQSSQSYSIFRKNVEDRSLWRRAPEAGVPPSMASSGFSDRERASPVEDLQVVGDVVHLCEGVPAWEIHLELANIANAQQKWGKVCEHLSKATILCPLDRGEAWVRCVKISENLFGTDSIFFRELEKKRIIDALRVYGEGNNLIFAKKIIEEVTTRWDSNSRDFLDVVMLYEQFEGFSAPLSTDVKKEQGRRLLGEQNLHLKSFLTLSLEKQAEGDWRGSLRITQRGVLKFPHSISLRHHYLLLLESMGFPRHDVLAAYQEAFDAAAHLLRWKIPYFCAQYNMRMGDYNNAGQALQEALNHCPDPQKWHVFSDRMYLDARYGMIENIAPLCEEAFSCTPIEYRYKLSIQWACLEEYLGNKEKSREILEEALDAYPNEWKVWRALHLFEERENNLGAAKALLEKSLKLFPKNGMLWYLSIRLNAEMGRFFDRQYENLQRALEKVPRSGELFCALAQCHLHPLLPTYNLEEASKHLEKAIELTPQYGDSFIEYARLLIIQKKDDMEFVLLKKEAQRLLNKHGVEWRACQQNSSENPAETLDTAIKIISTSLEKCADTYQQGRSLGDRPYDKATFLKHSSALGISYSNLEQSLKSGNISKKQYEMILFDTPTKRF